MMGSSDQRPPRLSYAGWLHQPLTPTTPMRPYPDGRVPPRTLVRRPQPGRGRWWTVLGVAACVAVVGATGVAVVSSDGERDNPAADLRGYHAVDNLCAITDTMPYMHAGFVLAPSRPAHPRYPLREAMLHRAVDTMRCTIQLVPTGSTDLTTLTANAKVHKQTDPGPEFAARFEAWTQSELTKDDSVTPVIGLGDEAYLVRRATEQADISGVTLGVRDGWTTYEISWLHRSAGEASTVRMPTIPEVVDLLKHTATTTLALLRA
ncbi:hypothetical protein [Nocardia sp. NPDC049149]|uniref:hypothetical protein n=1 Tax=Nocardia sp. NPDC049149 TaxID=3364315 RepID=UPI003714C134